MPQPADRAVTVSDFAGLIANADQIDQPEGAAVDQVNATCVVPGELRVRGGVRIVTFEDF